MRQVDKIMILKMKIKSGHYTSLRHINRIFWVNFEEPIWIRAEISEFKKTPTDIAIWVVEKIQLRPLIAKIKATIWAQLTTC